MRGITDDLTDEQREAVEHREGPLLVLAGAGTGKTRVITRRIAALVANGVRPERILAITFTNKAAGEMRERTQALIGGRPAVSTFHSFGARLLRRHAELVGLTRSYTIFDDSDQKAVIKEAAEEAKVDTDTWAPKVLLGGISKAKNQLLSPEDVEEQAISPKQRAIAAVYPVYEQLVRSRNGVDFDDLLVLSVKLLQTEAEVQRLWADWYRFVLVDEYQDTNHVQYQLAMCLAKGHRNLCVTGDPDQSIYGWRGADISNILNFERDFPDAHVVPLTKNFRSTQKILDAANRLIGFNVRRKDKKLVGQQGEGEDIALREFQSAEEEATWVARRISELRASGLKLQEIACLYRANFQSRLIEESLVHRGLPYQVVGAVAFYARKEVKDLLAYLRVLVNPNDDYAALRIVNTPPRRIGAGTLKAINGARMSQRRSLLDLCGDLDAVPGLKKRARAAVSAFASIIQRLQERARSAPVADVLRDLIDGIEYREYLEKAYPEDTDRWENVLALVDAAAEFDRDAAVRRPDEGDSADPMAERGPSPGVGGFLEHVALVSAVDDLDGERDRISLMTVHTAKGLEFESVFVVGLEDGIFPNARALDDPWGMEEERRLAYVAFTRAKRRLALTWSKMRSRFGKLDFLDPSPFLHESGLAPEPRRKAPKRETWDEVSQVPPDWDDDSSQVPGEGRRSRWRLVPDKREPKPKPTIAQLTVGTRFVGSSFSKPVKAGAAPFAEGDRVRHEHFGDGDVCSVTGHGPGTRVQVRFTQHGLKTLVLQYARLEKLS